MKILVTGGAGFIGSALIRYIINHTNDSVVNVDKLTYAGSLESLKDISKSKRYFFEKVDICDQMRMKQIFNIYKPDVVMHLAAESHVDRSINDPKVFIHSNIIGTYTLLEVARAYWHSLSTTNKEIFRFHHISTDEVYGELEDDNDYFTESSPYSPSSPYSASKASSDHLVRSWQRTYHMPTLITNCSNNYGPYQFPEKLIPLTILNALNGKKITVYGDGKQIRDWLFVDDHVRGLLTVLKKGQIGNTYNIGGHNEKRNIDVVQTICKLMEELCPIKPKGIDKYQDLITHINDRPGHDRRYAIDASKMKNQLDWIPIESFDTGLRKTIQWYLDNHSWCQHVANSNSVKRRTIDTEELMLI